MTNSDIASSAIPKPERTWAMFAHLSSFLGYTCIPLANIIAPLVIWQIKKEDMPFASDQGKECLNFQISMLIYIIISGILTLILIGFAFLLILYVMNIILTIIAAIKANEGVHYRYPMTMRFIK
ncbi:MAG: DUF4870 domain-containing protein [Akkermansiaceae bacterium]|nr:DUF4870 domain-containing protein [Akkermansiaceae bacterium]